MKTKPLLALAAAAAFSACVLPGAALARDGGRAAGSSGDGRYPYFTPSPYALPEPRRPERYREQRAVPYYPPEGPTVIDRDDRCDPCDGPNRRGYDRWDDRYDRRWRGWR